MRTREQTVNEVKMSFSAIPENEGFARYAVTALLMPLDPTVEELSDMRTAVSEAVTNAIIHGYRGRKDGEVYMSVKTFPDRKITVRVRDEGCGISDIEKAMEPLYTTDPSGERGGMGFAVMKSFTDRLTVRSAEGKGTTVTMTKKLSDPDQDGERKV
ncbi:MAG: anti-sigma F factor [Lachnospiraceae bacterium]|nr:anti-sigma F factor [Lachnospiraceae bacterium]